MTATFPMSVFVVHKKGVIDGHFKEGTVIFSTPIVLGLALG